MARQPSPHVADGTAAPPAASGGAAATGAAIPLAWVALDRGDNDPARCWCHIGAALETLCPGAGRQLTLLGAVPPPPLEVALTSLINALADLSQDVALVLDDYHAIETPAIHDGFLCEDRRRGERWRT